MGKIFVTSDLHFGHNKDFLYTPRGFSSIEEHDKEVIRRWNETVSEEDEVYILGDLMLNDNEHGIDCLTQLNGTKHFIIGNHDTDARIDLYVDNWLELEGYAAMLKYKKWRFYLSHYPTITNNMDDGEKPLKARTINLCGHSHLSDRFAEFRKGYLSYHVELDAHNCYPVLLDDIIEDIKSFKEDEECHIV